MYYPTYSDSSVSMGGNVLRLVRSSEQYGYDYSKKLFELGTRRMIEKRLFREQLLPLKTNKIFCSQWLSDGRIIMGTKCNKLIVLNAQSKSLKTLPSIYSSPNSVHILPDCGIHALATNPSQTYLVSGGPRSNDVAVYSLPDLQPVCVGEKGHKDWVFDIKWLDDEFFVSGARDSTVALWHLNRKERMQGSSRSYCYMEPVLVKTCKSADKVRALNFKPLSVLTTLSSNSYLHQWDMTTFSQVSSYKLPCEAENVCLVYHGDNNIFAVGSSTHVSLIDGSSYAVIKNISTKCRGNSVRSLSFRGNLLTVGSGIGIISFYDLRAGLFLDQLEHATPTKLDIYERWFYNTALSAYEEYSQTAVYTHSYDPSGTRLFTGGGPLAMYVQGCYAALWQ